MRIIPKRTKVRMELFKGIELVDVLVAGAGMGLSASFLVSNLPAHLALSIVTLIITVGLVVPIEDDKGYILIYNVLKYAGRYKIFYKRSAKEAVFKEAASREKQEDTGKKKGRGTKKKGPVISGMSLEDITPFTEIDGSFIAYGSSYSAVVMSIPSVEFRFYSESRQNSVIDRCFGSILRTAASDEVISMVKLDRPVIYDDLIQSEQVKMEDLKEAYLNGLLTDEELTIRVGIVHDRIRQLMDFDYKNKVYMPFHYLMFFHKDRNFLQGQIENAIATFAGNNMICHQLKGEELAVFLKYSYGMEFDEREVKNLSPEEYMDWILPDVVRFTGRTVQYDELITHNFRLRDYPMVVGNAWGSSMFNMLGTRVVLKMTPVDRYKAIRQIDRSIDELREQESNTGKTSKLMEVSMHIESLSEVLRLLQGENEVLFNVNTFVTVDDYELSQQQKTPEGRKTKNLTSFKKQVRRELSEEGFKVTDLFLQQFEAYSSAQLSGYDAFKKYQRGIQSSSVAAAFPYVYKSLCDDGGI